MVQGILNGLTPAFFQQFLVPLESLGVEQFGHGLQFPFRVPKERWDHTGSLRRLQGLLQNSYWSMYWNLSPVPSAQVNQVRDVAKFVMSFVERIRADYRSYILILAKIRPESSERELVDVPKKKSKKRPLRSCPCILLYVYNFT